VLTIRENYQRRRVHRFAQAVETNGLRVVVLATHGEPSAAIYEIRAYE
jgi:CHAT domain-containing protein